MLYLLIVISSNHNVGTLVALAAINFTFFLFPE